MKEARRRSAPVELSTLVGRLPSAAIVLSVGFAPSNDDLSPSGTNNTGQSAPELPLKHD
jgi:hypothetical protein